MKNMSILLVVIFILAAGAIRAHASLLQAPNGLYFSHPPVLGKFINIPPQGSAAVRVGVKIYHKKAIRKQEYVQAPPSDGAVIFIQSTPVGFLK